MLLLGQQKPFDFKVCLDNNKVFPLCLLSPILLQVHMTNKISPLTEPQISLLVKFPLVELVFLAVTSDGADQY